MIIYIMIIYIIAGYVILPTVFNLIVVTHKRKRTNKICIEKLNENGYEIDVRFKNALVKKIMEYYCKENIELKLCDYYLELALATWWPILRWYDLYCNFKYLQGDYTGLNKDYAVIEDSIGCEEVIDYLKKDELVKEDKEKNTFEELMDKYDKKDTCDMPPKKDPINVQESSKDIVFSKKDSIAELNEKLDQLRQLISEKQDEKLNDEVTKNQQIKGYVYKPENK